MWSKNKVPINVKKSNNKIKINQENVQLMTKYIVILKNVILMRLILIVKHIKTKRNRYTEDHGSLTMLNGY